MHFLNSVNIMECVNKFSFFHIFFFSTIVFILYVHAFECALMSHSH